MTINVLVAEDHAIVREGLCLIIDDTAGMRVIGTTSNGNKAVEMVAELHPDIVLMDLAMPGVNGIEATRMIKQRSSCRVVMLSMYAQEEYVLHALRAGASAYVLKESASDEIVEALHAVTRGETYLDPAIPGSVMRSYLDRTSINNSLSELSERQRDVLRLIVEGKATKEIAFELGLSPKTVETHRAKLMNRLRIRDLPSLVRYAMDHHFILSDN